MVTIKEFKGFTTVIFFFENNVAILILQGGPLAVINGVVTPISRAIITVTHL